GRQLILLRVSLSVLVLNVAANAAAIPLFGARGAAGALLASELLSLTLTMLAYRTVAQLPRVEQPLRLLTARAALLAASCVRFAIDDDVIALLAAIAAGSVAYFGTLAALHALPAYITRPVVSALRTLRPRSAA